MPGTRRNPTSVIRWLAAKVLRRVGHVLRRVSHRGMQRRAWWWHVDRVSQRCYALAHDVVRRQG